MEKDVESSCTREHNIQHMHSTRAAGWALPCLIQMRIVRNGPGSGYTPTSSERVSIVNQLVAGHIMGPMQRFSSEAHPGPPHDLGGFKIRGPAFPLEPLKTEDLTRIERVRTA